MNKDRIEISRADHISGYGVFYSPEQSESFVLDKIVEWSKSGKKSKKIYKHLVSVVEENYSDTRFHEVSMSNAPHRKIPYCDRVVYLDIYWQ